MTGDLSFIELLPWDTEFFQIRTARLLLPRIGKREMEQALKECRSARVRCLYFQADPLDPETILVAEEASFRLVDFRMVFCLPLGHLTSSVVSHDMPEGLVVNECRAEDLPMLDKIAIQISEWSRFTSDSNFGPQVSARLYTSWIRNSFHGEADKFLVARMDNRPIGLTTCKLQNYVVLLPLVGVETNARCQGVGRSLIGSAIEWSISKSASEVQVVTQGRNIPAQRLYQRAGFVIKETRLYYHKWFEEI